MHTRPECGNCSEELTKQQLFAQDLLEVLLAFHGEALGKNRDHTETDPNIKPQEPFVKL